MSEVAVFVIFMFSQFIKALRLRFVLGKYNIHTIVVFVFSSIGMCVSYVLGGGKPFVYEMFVAISLCLIYKIHLFAIIYTLFLLRIFDSILILLIAMFFNLPLSSIFYVFLLLLILCSWVLLSTLPVLLNRIERYILIGNMFGYFYTLTIRIISEIKEQLDLLSFKNHGTISISLLLTGLIWLFEILSLGIKNGDYHTGVNAVFNRISSSLGIESGDTIPYDYLITYLFIFSLLLLVIILFIRGAKKNV